MRHGAGRLARCEAKNGKEKKTRAPTRTSRRASSQRKPPGKDDLYTTTGSWPVCHPHAHAAGCGAHRKLAGADDLYTARAANQQLAPAGCRGLAHRKLAGVDDLYNARAAIRQPAPAGCGGLAHRKLAGVAGLQPAAGPGRLRGVGPQEARWR